MRALTVMIRSVLFVVALGFGGGTAFTQSMSYGPLFADGVNAQGLPIFMLRCSRRRCIGLHGRGMGTPKEVARYMPAIPAATIMRYGYRCWILCRDSQGNIVGKPSPDYHNPYAKG